VLDGNASDKTWNSRLIGELRDWLDTDNPPVYVADSSAVTEDTVDEADRQGISITSRLPRTKNLAEELINPALETDNWTDVGDLIDNDDVVDEAATYRLHGVEEAL